MPDKNRIGFYSFGLLFLLACFSLGNIIERHQSSILLLSYATMFITYLFLVQKKDHWKTLLLLGLLSRLLLFFHLPILSDDVFRFIWDGTLLKYGIHPFAELPNYYLDYPVAGLDKALFDQLNSPGYFTIYPPLNQALFWLCVQFDAGWLQSTNVLRGILLASDIGAFFLLRRLLLLYQKDENLAYWYFLNPLVILEVTGNLHFEGLVVFFLLLGMYGYKVGKHLISITGFGLAIGTKLLPLIYLPYLFFRGFRNKQWWLPIAAASLAVVTLLPLFDQTFISGMSSSLDLYFRKFEFNASLYFIAREVGIWFYGYNNIAKIGPLLSIISAVGIITFSGFGAFKKTDLPQAFLIILVIYLLFSTVIHPWYIIPLIAFGVLSGFWFPVCWSLLIFLTYTGYAKSGFELPPWIVVLEYVIVAIFAFLESRNRSNG